MATEQAVFDAMGAALWDPQPTGTSDIKAQQLAFALGYPSTWRVVRTLEEIHPEAAALAEQEMREDGEEKMAYEDEHKDDGNEMNHRLCIVDRIYAGEPGTGCDMWFNHGAAMMASQDWIDESPDPFRHKGGHMLPREPQFQKGDRVEVLFEHDWFEAKILRRKEHTEGFRYQVYYAVDKSKQSGIPEERIRELLTTKDPREIAMQIGLGEDWQAVSTGNNRWKITAPDGKVFTSKKAALAFMSDEPTSAGPGATSGTKDEGDPPWRTTDHEYLGRYVRWTQQHAVTARRTITVEQIGRVVGWISETDVDQAGEPGFISEKTGLPAKLFHVVFDDEEHLHRYSSHLIESQDLEEPELEECLIPPEELPSKKPRRK